MRTVKEISNITGISIRTLHYFDEIGLLEPTDKSDAGYQLYLLPEYIFCLLIYTLQIIHFSK